MQAPKETYSINVSFDSYTDAKRFDEYVASADKLSDICIIKSVIDLDMKDYHFEYEYEPTYYETIIQTYAYFIDKCLYMNIAADISLYIHDIDKEMYSILQNCDVREV